MDRTGQSLSATEFAVRTGVTRERLRTWERRFGFPEPVRVGGGPRRYAVEDAPRVVAVRRAAEQGVPLEQAIADAAGIASIAPAARVSRATLADVTLTAPTPLALVAGPEPLRIAFANARPLLPGAPAVGQRLDALAWFPGSELERTLRRLFTTDVAALECDLPGTPEGDLSERCVAYRLPVVPGEPPTVAVVAIDRAQERRLRRELQAARRERSEVHRRADLRRRGLALAAALAERFQREGGEGLLAGTAATLVRGLGAIDAGIAVYMAGELALGSSSRGLLGPRMVTVTGYDELAALLHAGGPDWLGTATAAAFGAPSGLQTLAVPIAVVGETLGVLLVLFDEQDALDEEARQLLTVVSAALGFTLLRDRLVASGREGAAPAS